VAPIERLRVRKRAECLAMRGRLRIGGGGQCRSDYQE
jgi:hypothetical protein